MIPGLTMGQGAGLTGGASGPAEGHQSTDMGFDTGFGGMGGFKVGNYYGKGSTSSQNSPLNIWVLAGVGGLVALWLLKRKK